LRPSVRLRPCGGCGAGHHIAGHITPCVAASNDGWISVAWQFSLFGNAGGCPRV